MNEPMDEERVQQIRRALNERETSDLLEIWQKNDRTEWTAEAFEAIRQILIERTGNAPEQAERIQPNLSMEESEDESEEADTYYDKEKLDRVATRAKNLATVVAVLFGFVLFAILIFLILTAFSSGSPVTSLLAATVALLAALTYFGFFWVVLQAIGEGIYILMDIEENTRKASKE